MGYYSEVAMVISGPKEAVLPFMMECKLNHPDLNAIWDEVTVGKDTICTPETFYIGFHFNSVKWYPEFDDVKRYVKLWDLASDKEGLRGDFCKLGEEELDMETDAFDNAEKDFSCRLLNFVRTIAVDVDLAKSADIRGEL